jgi:hypothetical protein
MRKRVLLLVLVGALAALSCASAAGAKTVWLCKPGALPDPCTPGLSTTVYSPSLHRESVEQPKAVRHPAVDCFYVYPTVSDQTTRHANLHIDPEENSTALFQAARYSQYCRVFAPMYRQVTVPYLQRTGNETLADLALPLADVRAAFKDFLARYSHGRGFVLIGHSQGSSLLRELIAKDIDTKPALRKRLVSAILMGGGVLVRHGSDVGGDFKHVRACHSATQLGCVIAFSTFDQPVPAASKFGRVRRAKYDVLCTNPAALTGGYGVLNPIFPSKPFAPGTLIALGTLLLGVKQPMPPTVWSTEPGAYRAHCSSANGAHVLQITALRGAPVPHPSPDATWGLHLMDANIALGNLIGVVRSEAAAYVRRGA